MDLIVAIYLVIGLYISLFKLSYVKREDSSMACIGACFITVLWPLYLIYNKLFKNDKLYKVYIARDDLMHRLSLFASKPLFNKDDGWVEDSGDLYVDNSIVLPYDWFPEVTQENSPKEIYLSL